MAPELLYPQMFGLRDARVSKQTDVYAFGIVVYEVLTGRPPFGAGGRRQAEIILRVIEGQRPSKPEKAGDIGFGGGTWDLVQQCWNQDRVKRPTVDKIRKHFHRVAGTSKVVPPGPTVPDHESGNSSASGPDSGSGNFSQYPLHLIQLTPNLTYNIPSWSIRPSFPDKHEYCPAGQVCCEPYGWWWRQFSPYVFCA